MKPKDKKAVKAVYDFVKKNLKEVTKNIDLGQGFSAKLVYMLYMNCEYELSLNETNVAKFNYPKTFVEAMKIFGGVEDYNFPNDIEWEEYLNIKELNTKLEELVDAADFREYDDSMCWLEYIEDYDTFVDYWEDFSGEFVDPDAPQPKVIRLSRDYNAVLKKGSNIVEVGCQRIPIETVREIVREYDAL